MARYLGIGGIGYITAAAGFLAGNVFFLIAGMAGAGYAPGRAESASGGKRLYGTALGFTAGLLLAFVCMSMLPEVFSEFGLAAGIAGLASGMAAAFFLEGLAASGARPANAGNGSPIRAEKRNRWERTGFLLALGVSAHNIPEGMALGALLYSDMTLGLSMAAIIAIHCFPEALAVLTPIRLAGYSGRKMLLISLALALPMSLGALAGGLVIRAWPSFASLCMSFAAGVMLYMACGDILPESKDVWRGRLSTIGAMAGFLAGVTLTGKLM